MKRIALLGSMAAMLVAGPVLASNTGFKLNYDLKTGGKNLVSLPYFYYPDGNINAPAWDSATCTPSVGATCETAEKLCIDLGTSTTCATQIKNIVKFNRDAQGKLQPTTHSCGGFTPFVLKPGDAYFVNVKVDCTADIVGSADDVYAFGKGGNSRVKLFAGNNNVSVPYHVKAVNSEDLCKDITNNNPGVGLLAVVKINPATGAPTTHSCGGFTPFPIVAGAGYFLSPKAGLTFPASYDIQFLTY